ncbi:TRAP transporter small permease [Spongorhabdus nitratireducens]
MNIQAAKNIIDRLIAVLVVSAMALLVFAVIWQVLSRFLPVTPSTVTEELARFLMLTVAMLGAAYTTGQKKHLAIDLVSSRLKGRNRRIADLLYHLVIALFALLVMVIGGIRFATTTLTLGQLSPALGIPVGLVYCIIPLAGAFIVFYSLLFLFECLWSTHYAEHSNTTVTVPTEKKPARSC